MDTLQLSHLQRFKGQCTNSFPHANTNTCYLQCWRFFKKRNRYFNVRHIALTFVTFNGIVAIVKSICLPDWIYVDNFVLITRSMEADTNKDRGNKYDIVSFILFNFYIYRSCWRFTSVYIIWRSFNFLPFELIMKTFKIFLTLLVFIFGIWSCKEYVDLTRFICC